MHGDDLSLEEPSPNDVQFLEERLYEFNVTATGIDDGRALGVFVRHASGGIVGAAVGHTWGGTCELRQVWVAEAQRRAGLGRRLVAAAEAEATRRGCSQLVLVTHSFQAPEFYRKLGFEVVSELQDYPRGHSYLLLRKSLL
jgi:ribosomal protein S18 acetylase RimI-like enzyme